MPQTPKNSILFFDVSKLEYLPLIQSVSATGLNLIINDTPLRREVENAGVPFQKWESFTQARASGLVQKEIIRIAEGFASALRLSEVQQEFASASGNFLPVTGELFVEQFMNLLAGEIITIETLIALVNSERLKLIVLGCDNSATERALLLYAKKIGIPTLQLAHGIQGKPNQAGVITRSRTASMHKLCSEFTAVFGRQMKEDLIEVGVQPERIFVTGCPFWDPLYSPESRISAVDARRKLGLNPKKPVILICSSYPDGSSLFFSDNSQTLFHHHQLALEAVKRIVPDAQVLLRPHPHELQRATNSPEFANAADDLYNKWAENCGYQRVQIMRDKKIEAIRAADIVLTLGTSSLITEAMILERPVVVLPWVKYHYHFVGEEDGVIMAENVSMLPGILSDLFARAEHRDDLIRRQQNSLPKINHQNDGRATERVADLIVSLAVPEQDSGEAFSPRGETGCETRLREHLQDARAAESGELECTSGGRAGRFKILQIVHDFPPFSFSGTELYTLNLSKELEKSGHEVTILHPVILPDKESYSFESTIYEGLNVIQFNVFKKNGPLRSDFYNPSFDTPFEDFLNSHNFDAVHFQHLYGLSVNWVSIAKSAGLPVLLKIDDMFFYCRQTHLMESGETYCAGPEFIDKCVACLNFENHKIAEDAAKIYQYLKFRKTVLQKIFREVDFVHSPSHFLKNSCIDNGFTNSEFHVIPTGISPFEVKEREQKKDNVIRIAFLGNIDVRKGIHDFLKGVELYQSKIMEETPHADFEFIIYGHHLNNDFYHKMMSRIENLKNVEYKGSFSPKDRADIFAEIDLMVMSSIGENYPFVLREALFANVPVIATEIAGVPEIVKHGKHGFLFPPGDVEALASIFVQLAKNPGILSELDPAADEIKLIAAETKELEQVYSQFIVMKKSAKRPVNDSLPICNI